MKKVWLRQKVSLVWLAACAGALVPVFLGVLLRLAYAFGEEELARQIARAIAACVWLPLSLISPDFAYRFNVSPGQLFLAAIALDSVIAGLIFLLGRSCRRVARRLLTSRHARNVAW